MKPHVICIVGPTAVGKSEIADDVAFSLGSEVVSVDSMQVYKGMDIGTAKVAPQNRKCKLHMVDIADVSELYSVARFQQDARMCVDEILSSKRTPILCGGTGLYLDAVIDEMSFPHGETGSNRRQVYESIAANDGPEKLYALLTERDAKSAKEIHPNNVRRVVRALEMLDEGTSYAEQHRGLKQRESHYETRMWALSIPREELYSRINRRVDKMFDAGLVEEVRALEYAGLEQNSTAGAAIGYKETLLYLHKELSLAEAIELVKRNSRRYAKRQLSWIRRDGRAKWIDLSAMGKSEAIEMICEDWRGHE